MVLADVSHSLISSLCSTSRCSIGFSFRLHSSHSWASICHWCIILILSSRAFWRHFSRLWLILCFVLLLNKAIGKTEYYLKLYRATSTAKWTWALQGNLYCQVDLSLTRWPVLPSLIESLIWGNMYCQVKLSLTRPLVLPAKSTCTLQDDLHCQINLSQLVFTIYWHDYQSCWKS